MRAWAEVVEAEKEALTALDAAIGDADHGSNMARGLAAVVAKLPSVEGGDSAALLKAVGMTLVSTVGGASGALYGTLFLQMAAGAGGQAALEPEAFAAALRRGVEGLAARGKAQRGDKTMIDALAPAVEALESSLAAGKGFAAALSDAAGAARAGAVAHHPAGGAQGEGELPGRAERGPSGPGRHLVGADGRGGGEGAGRDGGENWRQGRCGAGRPHEPGRSGGPGEGRAVIGLVLVSHSARLAEGVAELVRGAAGEAVPVRVAAGMSGAPRRGPRRARRSPSARCSAPTPPR